MSSIPADDTVPGSYGMQWVLHLLKAVPVYGKKPCLIAVSVNIATSRTRTGSALGRTIHCRDDSELKPRTSRRAVTSTRVQIKVDVFQEVSGPWTRSMWVEKQNTS